MNQVSVIINKSTLLSVISLILSVTLAGCIDHQSNIKNDVLVYCSEGSPETFNPQLSTSGTTFDASARTLYNRLVEFKPGSTFIQPALATDWQISKNGLEYVFNLRKNVNFHTTEYFQPSRQFNADDVLFTYLRQWNHTHPYHAVSKLNFGYFNSMGLDSLINRIEKVDKYTVKFKLNRADSTFLSTLAMDFASILSAEYADKLLIDQTPQLIDIHPIGTGPFQLVRYQPDAFIRYKAHPNYWHGKQKLQHLVFAITPNPSLRFARIIAKECDVMANPLPIHINAANKHSHMQVLSEPGLNIAYLSLNTNQKPFNNVQVRQALNHSINKENIVKAVYQQTATPAKTIIPPNMWDFNQVLKQPDYNPEKAKKMMAAAGYPNGFDMTIWTMSAQRAYNPNAKKMAELIQQDLKKVGINVQITTYEYGAFLYKTGQGEHHSALTGWIGDNGDPDNFFTPLLSCSGTSSGTNTSFWCDLEFGKLIQQARSKTNISERQKIYQQAQSIFIKASPVIPIAHATQHIIINSRVKNFKIISAGGIYFNDVFLSTVKHEKQHD